MLKRAHRKGFSLIEAAIVLGIVGLVIGGIWVAAAAVNNKQRLRQMTSGMLVINANIRELYQGQDASGYNRLDLMPEALTYLLRGADGFKVAPTDGGVFSYIIDPFGNRLFLRLDSNLIDYDIKANSVSDCVQIISSISGMAKSGLDKIGVGSTEYTTFPVMPSSSDCAAGGTFFIFFKF